MKQILFILILFSTLHSLSSQTITFSGYNNITSEIDTLLFGFAQNASIGIDTLLMEENLQNSPDSNLFAKVLQRSENNYACLVEYFNNNAEIYFSTSFDSKINLRQWDSQDIGNSYFQIFIPPYYENVIFESQENMDDFVKLIGLSGFNNLNNFGNCDSLIDGTVTIMDPIDNLTYSLNMGDFYTTTLITFQFRNDLTNLNNKHQITNLMDIYPNPFSKSIKLKNHSGKKLLGVLYNTLGLKLREFNINQYGLLELDTQFLPAGTYFILFKNKVTSELSFMPPIKLLKH